MGNEMPGMEEYRLILTHEYHDSDGTHIRLDEPVVITHCFPHLDMMPQSVVINEMMEKMKLYLLRECEHSGW